MSHQFSIILIKYCRVFWGLPRVTNSLLLTLNMFYPSPSANGKPPLTDYTISIVLSCIKGPVHLNPLVDWLSVSDWKKTYECKLGDYNAVSLERKLKSFSRLMDLCCCSKWLCCAALTSELFLLHYNKIWFCFKMTKVSKYAQELMDNLSHKYRRRRNSKYDSRRQRNSE